jgi:hypothetical protein
VCGEREERRERLRGTGKRNVCEKKWKGIEEFFFRAEMGDEGWWLMWFMTLLEVGLLWPRLAKVVFVGSVDLMLGRACFVIVPCWFIIFNLGSSISMTGQCWFRFFQR